MKTRVQKMLWVSLGMLLMAASLAASDSTIKGIVTDNAGKPVRGALVTATNENKKSVGRYTQNDGRYEITVPSGTYALAVEAFGFAGKRQEKDTTQPGETNFSLSPRWEVTRLSGAEIEPLIPDDTQGKLIKASCIDCHDLGIVLRRKGQTAAEWKSFLPNMTNGRRDQPVWSQARIDALGAALEKYFGPNSAYFGPDADPPTPEQVKHADISDAALSATITEWTVPAGADGFPHSIAVDAKRGIAWFSEVGNRGLDREKCALFTSTTSNAPGASCGHNYIGRFDIKTETFHEYPAPHPHTGAIGPDGRVWYAEAMRNNTSPNLAVIDPGTSQITYYKYGDKAGAHTPIVDRAGNVWISGGKGEIWRFDVETKQFASFKFPIPSKYPDYSVGTWKFVPGEPNPAPNGGTYHVSEDSTGKIWTSIFDLGMIVRIDPNTGETKEYFPPKALLVRGIYVDQHDNVWFAAYFEHKLGKLDPKTGTFTMYQPPTVGSTPYGIIEDKKTGYIWYADQSAYCITRFDPKTDKFVEYRLPLYSAVPRFIDVDPDSKVWFTDYWNGKIGVLDPGIGSKQVALR